VTWNVPGVSTNGEKEGKGEKERRKSKSAGMTGSQRKRIGQTKREGGG